VRGFFALIEVFSHFLLLFNCSISRRINIPKIIVLIVDVVLNPIVFNLIIYIKIERAVRSSIATLDRFFANLISPVCRPTLLRCFYTLLLGVVGDFA